MALPMLFHLKFRPPNVLEPRTTSDNHTSQLEVSSRKPISKYFYCHSHGVRLKHLMLYSRNFSSVLARASGDSGQSETFTGETQSSASDIDTLKNNSSGSSDGYIALFIRMLGLDNDPLDREQAVDAIWKYSLGGKQYVDNVMKYHGTVNLIVNLLQSDSDSACEAAAGFLSVLSSINVYRDIVAKSGAIEEISSLLRRSSLSSDAKEQAVCTLWNLSADEKLRMRIANSDILYLLIKFLEDEDVKLKEAAGGVLANLALSQSNHKTMVEAGVIPKLAKLLNADTEESKLVKKVARNTLLELAKDEYNRILIMEEGLLLVPLVGSSAYKSFKPALYTWPSLPDGTEIEQSAKIPSRYGASELLLGLNVDKTADLEEAKRNAVIGRTQQQFLARIGAIEIENDNSERSSGENMTILPWIDAVARLVLILGLEDESAISRAAGSIADTCINEHMRVSYREAGAVKLLVRLIDHQNKNVKVNAIRALDRLSISTVVCQTIEAEGALRPLVNLLKESRFETCHSLTGMILNILTRVLDPNKEMKSKFYGGAVNWLKKDQDLTKNPAVTAEENDIISSTPASSLQRFDGGDLIDSTFLSCLVDILKTSSNPELQKKAASILEFIAGTEPRVEIIIAAKIESGLQAVFQQNSIIEGEDPSLQILELEEAGQAISAASRLLTKLLDYDHFRQAINSHNFTNLLRDILVSPIPLHNKDWVAASLVKLTSLSGQTLIENPINTEVTLYETIPRLIETIESSSSIEVQEASVLELNRIVSEGMLDSTRGVASQGGIFPIVKLMESCSDRALEACLAILYNLSMDSENHAAIVAAGTVPVLKKVVISERPSWTRALRLLRTLPT